MGCLIINCIPNIQIPRVKIYNILLSRFLKSTQVLLIKKIELASSTFPYDD
jgi:hypothetical protein